MKDEGIFKEWYALQRELESVAVKYHNEKVDLELKAEYDQQIFVLTYKLWTLATTIRKSMLISLSKEPILDGYFEVELPIQSPDRHDKVRRVLEKFLLSRIETLSDKAHLGYEIAYSEPYITIRILTRRTCVASMEVARKVQQQTLQLAHTLGAAGFRRVSIAFNATQAQRPVRFGHPYAWDTERNMPQAMRA